MRKDQYQANTPISKQDIQELEDKLDNSGSSGAGGSLNASEINIDGTFTVENNKVVENDSVKKGFEKVQGQINAITQTFKNVPIEILLTAADFTSQTINGTVYVVCDLSPFVINTKNTYTIEVTGLTGLPIMLFPSPVNVAYGTEISIIKNINTLIYLSCDGFRIGGVNTNTSTETFFALDNLEANIDSSVYCMFKQCTNGYSSIDIL